MVNISRSLMLSLLLGISPLSQASDQGRGLGYNEWSNSGVGLFYSYRRYLAGDSIRRDLV